MTTTLIQRNIDTIAEELDAVASALSNKELYESSTQRYGLVKRALNKTVKRLKKISQDDVHLEPLLRPLSRLITMEYVEEKQARGQVMIAVQTNNLALLIASLENYVAEVEKNLTHIKSMMRLGA